MPFIAVTVLTHETINFASQCEVILVALLEPARDSYDSRASDMQFSSYPTGTNEAYETPSTKIIRVVAIRCRKAKPRKSLEFHHRMLFSAKLNDDKTLCFQSSSTCATTHQILPPRKRRRIFLYFQTALIFNVDLHYQVRCRHVSPPINDWHQASCVEC